jgi:hypothetical protein
MARKSFKNRVWRVQYGTMTGSNVVSAMTHDRQWVLHMPLTELWKLNFRGRHTFYAEADIVGRPGRHSLRIKREVREEDWK